MPGTSYAVLIGNSHFPDEPLLPALRCPVNDIESMQDVLASEKHGPYNVQLLPNWDHHAIQLAILRTLKKATYEDKVLIYYAGHGKINNDDSALYLAAANTNVEYLSASAVSVAEITKQMKFCASKQLILVLDCCYSGAIDKFMSADTLYRGDAAEQVGMNFRNALGSGTYVLTACSSLQRAAELEGDSNGLLTKHLVQGIRDGLADRDDDGLISMHELTTYVQEQVKREGDQTPSCFSFREEDGGLVIASTGKPARSRKIYEVQEAIYEAALARRATLRTTRAALTLLAPDPSASAATRAACNEFVDRLHNHRTDPRATMEILEEAYSLAHNLLVLPTAVRQEIEQQRDAALADAANLASALDAARSETQSVTAALQETLNEAAGLAGEQRRLVNEAEKNLLQRDKLRADLKTLQKELDEARSEKRKTQAETLREEAIKENLAQMTKKVEHMQQEHAQDQENLRKVKESLAQALEANQKKPSPAAKEPKAPPSRVRPVTRPLDPALVPQIKALKSTIEVVGAKNHESAVLAILKRYAKQPDFFIVPNIPAAKLSAAKTRYTMPIDEKVLALIDCTFFRSAKDSVLFGHRTIYWSNSNTAGVIAYKNLANAKLLAWGAGITINGNKVSINGSGFNADRFLEMVTELKNIGA